jgi:nucleoid DNA-binding protein
MDIEWSALTNLTLKDQHMATKKKAPAKKAPAKKAPVAKNAPAKKAPAKKAPAKKAPAVKKAAVAKKAPVAKKAAAKKAPARKVAAKKAPAKKAAVAAKPKAGVKAKMTKTAIINDIAESTNMTRAQVTSVMEELESVIERHIRKRSVGEFTLPGLLKIKAAKRPATKKRMGRNPATGEEIVIAAKPATTRVRISALKKLKDMIA